MFAQFFLSMVAPNVEQAKKELTPMRINADFSRCAVVTPRQYQWVASPQGGVERVMLDRVGVEVARATSIVRYAPDSWFPHHFHPGGEEILVLSGIFSEGETHYPAGWYLRSPPGSGHQPSSREGALIFVKLWQMQPDDTRTVRIDTRDPATWFRRDGRDVCMLFSDERELVCLERLGAGDAVFTEAVDGAELLVLSGTLTTKGRSFPQGSWIRLPAGRYPEFVAGTQGVSLYAKIGRAVVEVTNDMQIHPVVGWR